MEMIFPYNPNVKFKQFTPATANWTELNFESLMPDGAQRQVRIGTILVRTRNAAGTADGSPFQIYMNSSVVPPAGGTAGYLVSGAPPQFAYGGIPWNLFIRLTVSTDIVDLLVGY